MRVNREQVHDIAKEIERGYGITVRAMARMRTVTGILSEGHRFILKAVEEDSALRKMERLGRVLEQLHADGVRVARFRRTQAGTFVARIGSSRIVLQEWAPGRHTSLREETERHALCQAVARLHRSRVMTEPTDPQLFTTGDAGHKLLHRAQQFRRAVNSRDLEPYRAWLTPYVDDAVQIGTDLTTSGSLRVARWRDQMRKTLCHRDLAPHNALFSDGSLTLIDFDLAGYDARSYDLYQLINHALYFCGWDERLIDSMITAYDLAYPLCADNLDTLYRLLAYPALVVREVTGRHRSPCAIVRRLEWAHLVDQRRSEWARRLVRL